MSTSLVRLLALVVAWSAASASARPPFLAELPRLEAGGRPLELQALDRVRAGLPLSPEVALRPLARQPLAGGRGQVFTVREELDGIPVFRGDHRLVVDREGRVVSLVPGRSAWPGRPGPFLLDAPGAARIADALLNVEEIPPQAFEEGSLPIAGRDGEWSSIELEGLPEAAWARRVVLADGPTAAWQVELPARHDPAERWMLFVDATAGTELRRIYRSQHVEARGRVYPQGALQPSQIVDFVDGEVVTHPASPEGWTWADRSEGNNCYAWDDRAADGSGTEGLYSHGTGDPLSFDFPVTGVPVDDLDAAITNAFWAVNHAHDWFWERGFDEAAGNAQDENYGRGGLGGDRTRVSVQYRAGDEGLVAYNAATTYTSRGDGSYNQLIFGLWDRSGEMRDGALDTSMVMHEIGHLVALRSLGPDSACDDGLQADALHEGWGDYFAYALTGDPIVGAYVSGDEGGFRTRPLDDNNYTYLNLCNISRDRCVDTENGEIWAGALIDFRDAMVEAWGPEEGELRANRIIVQGMRHAACPPSFLDARDGMLTAELLLSGGEDRCRVWAAMAGRGMGLSASSDGPDDDLPFPGFDQPAECVGGASVGWTRERWGDDADGRVLLADATMEGAERLVEFSSSGGDVETVASLAGPTARLVGVRITPGPANPGDGVLQVVDGDTLSARCTDCPGRPQAESLVQRRVDLRISSIRLRAQTCDDDDDAGFDRPAMLDAGEYGILEVNLGNAETFGWEDVRVQASCDNPDVDFLPQGDLFVGDVRARTGTSWPFEIEYYLRGAPTLSFGDTATFTFRLTARGHEATTQLSLDLAADYVARFGEVAWGASETFEPGSPSVNDWFHEPAGGKDGDQWGIQDCGDGQGPAMVHAGPNCTEYSDEPTAARLGSPPLFPPGLAAVEPTGISWRNWADLGREPRSLYCDSEMVVAYLSDDPERPSFENPLVDRGGSVAWWAQLTAFSDERNTNGSWVNAVPQQTIDDNDVRGMDLSQVRLWWYFFTDVYNPATSGGCRNDDADAVGLGYRLDDVSFTYDALERVPTDPGLVCDPRPCLARAHLVIEGPEQPCPGESLFLDGTGNEALNCPNGLVEHRFTGPGFDTGWGSDTTAVAPAADGNFTSRVRCVEDTSCADTESIRVRTLDSSQGGRVARESLRLRRVGADLRLWWNGTRAPESHAVFRADTDAAGRFTVLEEMSTRPPADTHRKANPWGREHLDPGAAASGVELSYYRVFGGDPCTGAAVDR